MLSTNIFPAQFIIRQKQWKWSTFQYVTKIESKVLSNRDGVKKIYNVEYWLYTLYKLEKKILEIYIYIHKALYGDWEIYLTRNVEGDINKVQ